MLISKSRRFIFIHIYKNAGTSITAALLPFAVSPWQHKLNKVFKNAGIFQYSPQPYASHIQASELVKILGRKTFQQYFSFAFVRNPWDWQVSLYNYMLKTPTHYQHDFIQSLGDFTTYLEWRCASEVRLQKDFVFSEDGEQLVSFVGRYENLYADFEKICSRIGVSASLPVLNVSRERLYQHYYTPKTINWVAKAFAPDIETFGYDFE